MKEDYESTTMKSNSSTMIDLMRNDEDEEDQELRVPINYKLTDSAAGTSDNRAESSNKFDPAIF